MKRKNDFKPISEVSEIVYSDDVYVPKLIAKFETDDNGKFILGDDNDDEILKKLEEVKCNFCMASDYLSTAIDLISELNEEIQPDYIVYNLCSLTAFTYQMASSLADFFNDLSNKEFSNLTLLFPANLSPKELFFRSHG